MDSSVRSGIVFGRNESAILRRLAEPGSPRLVTTKDAIDYVGRDVSSNSLAHSMSFLSTKGLLERVGKGLYLSRNNNLSPRITELVPWVFRDLRYYIGLNAAANYWGLTPQIPSVYQAIYVAKDEAIARRIERWCLMLSKKQGLGGELRPVKSKVSTVIDHGITRKTIGETQLPISNVEATLVDGMTYTDEVGGADEILHWMKTGVNGKLVDLDGFARLTSSVSSELSSVNARVGFLLEYLLNAGLVAPARRPVVNRLVKQAQDRLDRHPTYRWGKESGRSEYFRNWRLHLSKAYLDQLSTAASFE
jgi:predicted transcriptional regulator of viral defense system